MTFYSLFTPKGASDKLTCGFLELQSECLDSFIHLANQCTELWTLHWGRGTDDLSVSYQWYFSLLLL